MNTKSWIIFAVACVLVLGGLAYLSNKDRVDVSDVNANSILKSTENSGNVGDHVFGNKDAKVVLTEYGDFQCPGCGSAHPTVKALSQKYKDQLAFVFRNFPLTQIHPNARAAAAAAEVAGKEGKYWEMHDALYESQNSWKDTSADQRGSLFAGYAEQAGLKKSTFEANLSKNSASVNRKINFDIALGRKVGVDATPTFFLNGKKLTSEQTNGQAAFEKTLVEAFKKAGVTVPETTEAATQTPS
jgi:protein-disulfide isomerase